MRHRLGQVAAGVTDQGHRRSAGRDLLQHHVVDLGALDVRVSREQREQALRRVGVEVDTEPGAAAGDDEGFAERGDRGRDDLAVEALAGQQRLRTVAVGEVGVGVRRGERRRFGEREPGAAPIGESPIAEELGDALEEVDETLRARVDDVVAGQHRELPRRVGEGNARRLERAAQQLAEIRHAAGVLIDAGAPLPEHREDRALDRALKGLLRRLDPPSHRDGEVPGGDHDLGADRLGETVEELREDRARVAARAVERRVGGDASGLSDGDSGRHGQRRGGGPQGGGEVGAGVGVRNREDVDAVERLLLAYDRQRAGAQRAREPRPGERLDHQRFPGAVGTRAVAPLTPRTPRPRPSR